MKSIAVIIAVFVFAQSAFADCAADAETMLDKNKKRDAIALIEGCIDDKAGEEAHLLTLLGRAYRKSGDVESARDALDRAINLAPGRAQAYYERGRLLQRRKEKDAALADYSRAIELDDTHARAYFHRASIYRSNRLDHLAIDDYNRAIAIDPGYVKAHTQRAFTYLLPLLPVLLVLALG